MTIATILPNGRSAFYDQNGVPLVGGKVYMYIPNTAVFKNTWMDAGMTMLNTNPITLDQDGSALIYGTGQYTQSVYDVNNNLIWTALTQDILGLFYPQTNPTNGSALIGFLPINGVSRTVYSKLLDFQFSVKDFGAVGDGVTDDTAALQDAFNALTIQNGVLHIPAGSYRITSPISTTFTYTAANSIFRPCIIGDGEGSTQILWDGANTPTNYAITINRVDTEPGDGTQAFSTIGGFSIEPISGAKNFWINGLSLQKWSMLHLHDIQASFLNRPIMLDQVQNSKIDTVHCLNNQYGLHCIGEPSSTLSSVYNGNSLTFINCRNDFNALNGFSSVDGNFSYYGGTITNNAQGAAAGQGWGAYVSNSPTNIGSNNVCNFNGVSFSGNGTTGNPGVNNGFADVYIFHQNSGENQNYTIEGCKFYRTTANYASYGVYMNKAATTIAGLNVNNSIFANDSTYTPPGSADYIKIEDTGGGLGNVNISALGVSYQNASEEPGFIKGTVYLPGSIGGYTHVRSYCATAYLTGPLSIPNTTQTTIPFNNTSINDASIWSVSFPTRLTVPSICSRVRVEGAIRYTSASNSQSYTLRIYKNGAPFIGSPFVSQAGASLTFACSMNVSSGVVPVNPGDYFELVTSQTSGGSLNLDDTTFSDPNWFSLQIIE